MIQKAERGQRQWARPNSRHPRSWTEGLRDEDQHPEIQDSLDGEPEAPSSGNPQAETLGDCPDFCSNLVDSAAQAGGNPGIRGDASAGKCRLHIQTE